MEGDSISLTCWYKYFTSTSIHIEILYFGHKFRPKKGKVGPRYADVLLLLHMCSGGCEIFVPTCQTDSLPFHSISGLFLLTICILTTSLS